MDKQLSRPIAIDLFCGAGGLSLGLEQAGFDVVASVEIDPVHACVHRYNFPECIVIPQSVVGLSGTRIRERAGIEEKDIDLIAGGAPCQGFSLIGHRALDDPRNMLVKEFVRIVAELRPRYFLFENVKGLTIGRHREFLFEIISAFEGIGYSIAKPWRVLNASRFGVPQDRERLFLIGAREDMPISTYPEETTRPAGTPCELSGLPEGPSCADAIGDIPDLDTFGELESSDFVAAKFTRPISRFAREMRCWGRGTWHFGYPRVWDRRLLTSSMRTAHSEISRRRFTETAQGEVEPISRFFRLPADGISNTLRAGTDSARGAFTSPRPIHYKYGRCISVREMARLHGFPDWFRFHETKWHGARQVGNAVAPPVARAIGIAILKGAGVVPTKPSRSMSLGDSKLLSLGMAEAAAHWNVAVPIGRRDQKSGQRKRKQEDIEAERVRSLRPVLRMR